MNHKTELKEPQIRSMIKHLLPAILKQKKSDFKQFRKEAK